MTDQLSEIPAPDDSDPGYGFLDFAQDHLEDHGVAYGFDLSAYGDYVAAANGMGC